VSKQQYSSEREYFSVRWAIPGFILILIVGAVNYVPILAFLRIISTTESSSDKILEALLTILPFLLSGPGLGFLVSQIWFKRNDPILRRKEFNSLVKYLKKKCLALHRVPNKKNQRLRIMEAFSDFAVYLIRGQKLLNYAHRRWDMCILLGSTYWALITGFVAGWLVRISYGLHFWGPSGMSLKLSVNVQRSILGEIPLQLLLFFLVVVFIVVIYRQGQNVWNQFSLTYEALIRYSVSRNPKQLHQAFPDYYPRTPENSGELKA
jgi:hypothetical protein